jgi:3-hydroxyacyl-CoA dehydrogenase
MIAEDQSAAARAYLAQAEQDCWIVPDVPEDTPALPVSSVGVIGAGTMGGGISMNFLNVGLPVTLVETRQEALDRGLATIRRNYERSASRGRFSMEEVEQRMARLTPTLDFQALAGCDLIIEAVFEDMALKKQVFARLDATAKPGAILASNTSFLDIDEIASATTRPESVLGMHFFSPANVMRLLEVVRGEATSKPVIATAMQLGRRIGKVAVLVGVAYGFVGNRMLAPRQEEANALILEGAMPWDVDRALNDFGFRMGPFAMADLAGLDIGWSRETSTGESLRDLLCEMDRRGQKNGAGFYDYDAERNASPSPVVERLIRDFAAKGGIPQRTFTQEEIRDRCLHPMINTAALIIEEGKAIRASDIDVVWVNGFGWPADKGGPMYYADQIGADRVLATMRMLETERGPQHRPAALLERLAAQGGRFLDIPPSDGTPKGDHHA